MTCCPPRPLTVRYQKVSASIGVGPTGPAGADGAAGAPGAPAPAIPAPYLVATSNIALAGIVTVDGVSSAAAVAANKPILPTAQTNPVENGPWLPNDSGAWTRPDYYDSSADIAASLGIVSGAVIAGTLGTGTVWFQSSGTTIGGSKTWTKLSTPSLLQDAQSQTLPAQTLTQHKGAAILKDPTNGRNTVDHGRADPREYGALAVATETTGTCAAGGSAAITLAAENGHENGSWLFMHGAGPDHGMATPAAPTAVVQGTTGATQWEFQIVAMTRSYGYTAASPVCNVTNAPATLTDNSYTLSGGVMSGYTPGNFIELYFTPVPGAMWYLVYGRKNGAGGFAFKGAAIAYPASYYQDVVASFRFVSETTRGVPSGIPSTPPVAARVNALRTQVVSGGRTTSLTVKPKPYTAATATVVEHCSKIPFEDAMNAVSGGVFGGRAGGLVKPTPGTYPITGDLRVTRSLTIEGTSDSLSSSGVILQPKPGVQFGVDQGNMAPPRQPGELVRVGDRRQVTIHGIQGINFNYMMYCTAVTSTDGTWGKTATGGDPAWNMADGATTTDDEVTWKTNGNSYYANAFNACVRGIHLKYSGTNGIPEGRSVALKDMRLSWRNYQNPGTGAFWGPGIQVDAGQVVLPTNANRNGKMMICTVPGTTGGTEPTWSRVNGATVAGDGGVSYVVYDQPLVQGAAVLLTTVCKVSLGVENSCGTNALMNGDSSRGYATNDSNIKVRAVSSTRGHGFYAFGSDGQQSKIHVNARSAGGGIGYGDDSFYGNPATVLIGDSSSKFQNTPHASQNVQTSGWLKQCYSESGPVDWNYPGRVQGGAGMQNQFGSAVVDGIGFYDSKRQFDTGLAVGSREHFYIGGVAGNGGHGLRASEGTEAALTFYESGTDWHPTSKRIRHGLTQNTNAPTAEDAVYSGRGRMRVFPLGLRVGAGGFFQQERLVQPVTAVPTVGAFAPGDWMPWAQDMRRLAIVPTRYGAEGMANRANSTTYTLGLVRRSTGNKVFVCVYGGTSAGSEPAGLNAASVNDFVQDGTVWWQMVLTSTYNQTAKLRGIPAWDAEFTTLTNADQTINSGIGVGPCWDAATATANRTITLGTTVAMPGDGVRIRIAAPVGFTWTFVNGGTGGGNAAVVPVNTAVLLDFVLNDAGAWVLIRATAIGVPSAEQSGTATLVLGVSAAIAANISAVSCIVVTLKTPNTDALTVKYACLGTDRVTGTPGSFKISALDATGGGAINTADVSTLDWRVVK